MQVNSFFLSFVDFHFVGGHLFAFFQANDVDFFVTAHA